MSLLISLQEYLRFHAHQHHEVVHSPPFTLFFHSTNTHSWANYALPDAYWDGDIQGGLKRLQYLFSEHDRKPCLRFIEEVFPHLPLVLCSSGWVEVERPKIMICTPETFHPASELLGLEIITLSRGSSPEAICEGLDTKSLGFDPQAERATFQEAEEFRRDLLYNRAFTVRLQDQPVGAGMFTSIHEGITELVGITTLEPFRRRGIAMALTAAMTQVAFKQGATVVFLIAGSEHAGRVYERVGFRPSALLGVYEAPSTPFGREV